MKSSDTLAPYGLFLAAAVAMIFVGSFFQLMLPIQFGLMLSEVVCILGVALVFRRVTPDIVFAGFGKPSISAWNLGLVILASAVLGLFANVVAGIIVELIPALQERQKLYQESIKELLNPGTTAMAVAGIVSITVFAPVCEEFLFRGTILPAQLKNVRVARAVLINGALFAAIHFNEVAFVSLAIIGAFFAHVAVRTRTLWPVIFGHAALNAVNGVVLPFAIKQLPEANLEEPTLASLLPAFVILGLATAGLWRATVVRLAADH